MPTTPKPTAARQQRRRHRGRRCVSGRNRAWVGPRGQKESMLSLDRLHARQRPRGSPNPVSRAKTGLLTGKCKRLRNPTRARATTVWPRSNVSAPGQSLYCGERSLSPASRSWCGARHSGGAGGMGLVSMPCRASGVRTWFAHRDVQGSDARTRPGADGRSVRRRATWSRRGAVAWRVK
jgi:hypothetical protein